MRMLFSLISKKCFCVKLSYEYLRNKFEDSRNWTHKF